MDATFGRVNLADGFVAVDVAVQSDGGVVVLAEGIDAAVALVRLTGSGDVDPNFGSDGRVVLAEGGAISGRVAVGEDDRIAATFSTASGNRMQAFATMVLLDAGGAELARTAPIAGDFTALAVVGDDVIAGVSFGTLGFVGYQPAVVRVEASGTLTRLLELSTPVRGIDVDSSDRVVLSMFAESDPVADHTNVMRLRADGTVDASFAFGGVASVATGVQRRPNDTIEPVGGGVAVDAADRIVVSGSPPHRLLVDGREDPSFDARSLPLPTLAVHGVDGGGGILLGSTYENLVVRLAADGSWDTSFGRCGTAAGIGNVAVAGGTAVGVSHGEVVQLRLDAGAPAEEIHEPGVVTVADTGAVRTFGGACFAGAVSFGLNRPVVTIETTPSALGYWLAAGDGGVFTFGDAPFLGSTGAMRLNQPVVTMASTATGRGYWLVAADGGVFTFGDAPFLGSLGALRLNQPIVGMTPTPSGRGYWLVASDGGVFTFGDAAYLGSGPERGVRSAVADIARTPSGRGYWLLTIDGEILRFGDATNHGGPSLGERVPTALVVVPGGYAVAYDRDIFLDVLSEDISLATGFRQGRPGTVVDAAYAS